MNTHMTRNDAMELPLFPSKISYGQLFSIQFIVVLIDIMGKTQSILGEKSVMSTETLLNRPFPSLFVKTSFVCPKADTDTKITIS